ncbi:TetR/AcrR family transcriptional regulator [Pseudonocardia sp. TRM90224]|uniref:TetR/AcrR family transcriptional regulator n=1 Tax=Pseudonocardia sp. TRM90224 TaxID=2812678 RepID=UPI001E2D3CA9|nr:TetR/AcrR family transcriptional regulator [Pseudonocardia sp. TRM90224]
MTPEVRKAGTGAGGRPRDPELGPAVLAAAAELVVRRGYHGVRMEELAQLAGTTKTAIYRRWPSRAAVLLDLVAQRMPPPVEVDAVLPSGMAGSAENEDVVAASRLLARSLSDPAVVHCVMGLLAEAVHQPELGAQFRAKLIEPQIAAADALVAAAKKAGRCPPWVSGALLADIMTGSVLQHVVVRGQPADDAFFAELAQFVGNALR